MRTNSMKIPFSKMHGLGNDFVVVENLKRQFSFSADEIRRMANRHTGIGFDQLLLIEPPKTEQVDFHYRIFNADGGEVVQCGNGARCFAHYVYVRGLTNKREIHVSTQAGRLILFIEDNQQVRVHMGVPRLDLHGVVECLEQEVTAGFVSLGNPHAVLEVSDIHSAPVQAYGKLLNQSSQFPEGINAGFMQVVTPQRILLRVYERGVGETLACGSGACAAVVIGCARKQLKSPVDVDVLGGVLRVDWAGENAPVWLIGPAAFVFEGVYEMDN